jgi:hypothetical protein
VREFGRCLPGQISQRSNTSFLDRDLYSLVHARKYQVFASPRFHARRLGACRSGWLVCARTKKPRCISEPAHRVVESPRGILVRIYKLQDACKRATRRGSGWCGVPGRVAYTTAETPSYFQSASGLLWITSPAKAPPACHKDNGKFRCDSGVPVPRLLIAVHRLAAIPRQRLGPGGACATTLRFLIEFDCLLALALG